MGLVPQSSVRSDIDQPLMFNGQFASQVALDLLVLSRRSNFDNVFIGKVFDSGVGFTPVSLRILTDRDLPMQICVSVQSRHARSGKINPVSRIKNSFIHMIKYLNSTAF